MKPQLIKCGYILLLLILVINAKVKSQDIQRKIADRYGLEAFEEISSIKFTFNKSKNGNSISRRWLWRPKQNLVSLLNIENDSILICYSAESLQRQDFTLAVTHKLFTNDQHWLFFPLHLNWDRSTSTSWEEGIQAPISKEKMNCLTILYPGFEHAPGDVYRLYVTEELKIREWSYCKGGMGNRQARSSTWEGHWYYGGLLLSTIRIGEGGDFKIWFTDIEVSYNEREGNGSSGN